VKLIPRDLKYAAGLGIELAIVNPQETVVPFTRAAT